MPESVRTVLANRNVSIYIYPRDESKDDTVYFLVSPRITFLEKTIIFTDSQTGEQFIWPKADVKEFHATRIQAVAAHDGGEI